MVIEKKVIMVKFLLEIRVQFHLKILLHKISKNKKIKKTLLNNKILTDQFLKLILLLVQVR